ncbi:MAG: hypothetical protein A3A44_03415 [Candidatus Sungbacteria bacterium RIFCSPLOWO2_01_FULL_60_25]|uniref:Uncharacterized protein n=1 Tax=Candidatus Sungbacteria bacterium RIFCSPLOWO2_01_FULL_60_25 TaxID=1802281 RepID=A0A1G2LCG5_9BACT|nr:MAG: hypothetical protein A3A44_03415 [Candidatus Sungbacteria bacterium RIFCSPLOWO2_01_FULL_60_25]
MNPESSDRKHRPQEFLAIAQDEYRKLAELGLPPPETAAYFTQRARLVLESRGRAYLKMKTNPAEAVEMLILSGALEKSDVRTILKDQLDRLANSGNEEEQGALVDICKRLVSPTAEGFRKRDRQP